MANDRAQNGGGKATPIEEGLLAQFGAKVRQTWDFWFGPQEPLPQNAPEGTQPRGFDFPYAFNRQRQPKYNEGISFDQLRILADSCDVVRIIIETRKDQMRKQRGSFRLKPKAGEKQSDVDAASEKDARIQALNEFFRFPDKEHSWEQWLGMMLEEYFVIDALSIWLRPTVGGDLYSVQVLDGGTIKRIIDETACTPLPPKIAYQQIIKGMIAAEFTTDELLYLPRNVRAHKVYGYSPVEQIITTINIALRRAARQLAANTDGNIPRALIPCPEDWTGDQIRKAQEWFDEMLSGNDRNRSKGIFIPGVGTPVFPGAEQLKDEFDEWIARIACYCFSVSPTPFIKQMNRATAESQLEEATEEGLIPIRQYVKGGLDLICQLKLGFADIEWYWHDDRSEDPLKQAQADDYDINNGVRSRDECREARGLQPMGGISAQQTIKTAAGVMPLEDAAQNAVDMAAQNLENAKNPPEPKGGFAGKVEDVYLVKGKKKLLMVQSAPTGKVPTKTRKSLAKYLSKFLRKEGKRLAKLARQHYSPVTKQADNADALLGYLGLEDWTEVVTEVADDLHVVDYESGKRVLAELSLKDGDMLDVFNDRALEYARQRAAEMVGKRYNSKGELVDNPDADWTITEPTRNRLRTVIQSAFTEGLSPQQLADKIENDYAFSATRAEVIARTEVGDAHVAGAMDAAKEFGGITRKKSVLSDLHDDDDECDEAADDGWIPIEELFSNGEMAPTYHPNCECALLLDAGEDDGAL